MKKCFITFVDGEKYEKLADLLKKSIKLYSQYELIIYKNNDIHNFHSFSDPSNYSSGAASMAFANKILCCLKALESYDEVAWIDCDCIVTTNIDKIWFESYRLKNYPLLPLARFSNFDEAIIPQKKFTYINEEALDYFDIKNMEYDYMQACFMYFNKNSIDFFKVVLSFFDENYNPKIFHFADETIINCLFIKYGYKDNLGSCFLCSYYFNYLLQDYIISKTKDEFYNHFSRFNIKDNNFSEILFLHGSKDLILHESYITFMDKKNIYSDIPKNLLIKKINKLNYDLSFNEVPKITINSNIIDDWQVEFIKDGKLFHKTNLQNNMWCSVYKKYYVDWNILVKNKDNIYLDYKLDLSNKNVLIKIQSGSLGDVIAWIPYIEEFRIKHNCKIYCDTKYFDLFEIEYTNITFIKYNRHYLEYFATYEIGYFINEENKIEGDVRNMGLQQIACKILNLEYREIKPKIKLYNKESTEKSVCIAVQSTAQCKYWNNDQGWINTVEYLNNLGYKVYCIDKNYSFGAIEKMNLIPHNAIDKTGDASLHERIKQICSADFFIGLGSGLSWLAWACKKPVIMISGFSDPKSEFYTPYRVHNKNVCNSCWNDSSVEFDKGDWLWCPRNKNFECSKEITFEMVKEKIDQCINDLKI
jgi:autotransporter strand-loop-strand O-heptosyltransferase